jgi:hypothetical protein
MNEYLNPTDVTISRLQHMRDVYVAVREGRVAALASVDAEIALIDAALSARQCPPLAAT